MTSHEKEVKWGDLWKVKKVSDLKPFREKLAQDTEMTPEEREDLEADLAAKEAELAGTDTTTPPA